MAKLTEYRSKTPASIPGLPDTTNITDPQLRLFLDRIKLFCSDLAVTVSNIQRYNDINNIATDLMGSDVFNSMIENKITQTAKPIVDDSITQNNNRQDKNKNKNIKLTGLEVDPDNINIAINGSNTKNVYERYIPGNTSDQYRGVTWSSSDANIATVDENGIVTAVAIGECEVIATSVYDKKITASATVTVAEATTITVTANYSWATGAYADAVFTEEASPGSGDCVWNGTNNVVTVFPNQSEAEAKAESALTLVKAADNRDYIVADDKRYWRDESKDKDQEGDSDIITAYKCQKDDDANDNLWVEKRPTDADVTGRVWNKVWEGAPAEGVGNPEYLATKNVVANDLEWKQKTTDAKYPCSIQISPNVYSGYFVPQETLIFSGVSYDWWEIRGYVDFTGAKPNLSTEFWVYGGRLPYDDTRLDLSKYSLEERLDIAAFGHGSGTNPGMIHDRSHVLVDGVETLPENTIYGTFYKEGSVEETGFYHNDKFYVLVPSGDEGYVYGENSVTAYAWTLSPCKGDETIYTETETPSAGVSFGTVADDTFTVTGTVSATGSGVYSITGNNGITYYYNG